MDLLRRIEFFKDYSNSSSLSFSISHFTQELNDDKSYATDFVEDALMIIVSKFTSNYRILFLIYGCLFSIFASSNIWYFLRQFDLQINRQMVVYFLLFIFVIPIWYIGIFRFYFAAQIFLFGLIRFINCKNFLFLGISLFSIVVHFSFVFPFVAVGLFLITGVKTWLNFLFLVSSIFIGSVNVSGINTIDFFPSAYENKIRGYTNEEYVNVINENKGLSTNRWFLNFKGDAIKISFLLLYVVMFFKRKEIKTHFKLNRFMNFGMIFFALVLSVDNIPSMDRFNMVSYFLSSAVVLILFKYVDFNTVFLKGIIIGTSLLILLYLIVEFRIGLETLGFFTVFGNLFCVFFANDNFSILDYIK